MKNYDPRILLILLIVIFLGTTSASNLHLSLTQPIMSTTTPAPTCQNSDMYCRTPDLIQKYGYPVETHSVTTPDGYILISHRIPYGRKSPPPGVNQSKPVVFLAHGAWCSSSDFLMNTVDKALGYKLADAGYDVWLGNARGNSYSINHVNLTSNNPVYWNFSFHEMGNIDVPLWIDYILNATGQEDLYYIGHSMGTTQFFVTMTLHPEYNTKIRTMFAMAPVVFYNSTTSFLKYMAPFSPIETVILQMLGGAEFIPAVFQDNLKYLGYACDEKVEIYGVCDNILYFLFGYDFDQTNSTEVPIILAHTPDSISSKAINHYLQEINSARFCQYDYGLLLNQQYYHQDSPPDYDLSKISVPVVFFQSDNDLLADPNDVNRSALSFPNLKENNRVMLSSFTHIDFTYAIDADKYVYNHILQIMDNSKYYPWN